MKTRRFIIQKLYNFRKREGREKRSPEKCCYFMTEISCFYWSTRNLKNTIEIYGLIGIIYKFIKLDFDSKLGWIFSYKLWLISLPPKALLSGREAMQCVRKQFVKIRPPININKKICNLAY